MKISFISLILFSILGANEAPDLFSKYQTAENTRISGDFEQARKLYLECLEIAPGMPHVLRGLGLIEMQRNNLRQAQVYFEKAIESDASFIPAYSALESLLRMQNKNVEADKINSEIQTLSNSANSTENGDPLKAAYQRHLANPNDPQPLLDMANIYKKSGEKEKAEQFRELAQKRYYEQLEQKVDTSKIDQENPVTPQDHYAKGRRFLRDNDLDNALFEFQQAQRLDANFPLAYEGLARIYIAKEEYGNAKLMLYKAMNIAPDLVAAKDLLKEISAKREQKPISMATPIKSYDTAEYSQHLKDTLAIDNSIKIESSELSNNTEKKINNNELNSPTIHDETNDTLSTPELKSETTKNDQYYIPISPYSSSSEGTDLDFGALISMDYNPIEKREYTAPINPEEHDSPFANYRRGLRHINDEEFDEAKAAFDKALSEIPNYPQAYEGYGLLSMKQNNWEEAKSYMEKAIQADSTYIPAYLGLAKVLIKSNDFENARWLLNKAKMQDPYNSEIYYQLADLFTKLGESDRASEYIAHAKELAKNELSLLSEQVKQEISTTTDTLAQSTPTEEQGSQSFVFPDTTGYGISGRKPIIGPECEPKSGASHSYIDLDGDGILNGLDIACNARRQYGREWDPTEYERYPEQVVCVDVLVDAICGVPEIGIQGTGYDLKSKMKADFRARPSTYPIGENADDPLFYRRTMNFVTYLRNIGKWDDPSNPNDDIGWKVGDVLFWDIDQEGRPSHSAVVTEVRDSKPYMIVYVTLYRYGITEEFIWPKKYEDKLYGHGRDW